MAEHKASITSFLASKGLTTTSAWLDDFLAQQRSGLSATQVQKTALFRLLASDITTSLQRTATRLPSNVADPITATMHIAGSIVLQLLDIEDIGSSAWSQVESIEAQERGETTRGNQVIRVVADEDGEPHTAPPRTRGPHKLLLEDIAGTKVYAFDTSPIKDIEIGCSIGLKLILQDVQVARGMLLLRPEQVTVLGGKIDALHTTWQSERKRRLQEKATQEANG